MANGVFDHSDESSDSEKGELITEIGVPVGSATATKRKEDDEPVVIPCLGNNSRLKWVGGAKAANSSKVTLAQRLDNRTSRRTPQVTGAEPRTRKKKQYGLRFVRPPPPKVQRLESSASVSKEELPRNSVQTNGVSNGPQSVEEIAVLEIIAEAKQVTSTEQVADHDKAPVDNLILPMTDQERLRKDIDECPEVEDNAYKRISVDQFGRALLRGMGWTDGVPIGRTASSREHVEMATEPSKATPRPSLLGLGATPLKVGGKVVPTPGPLRPGTKTRDMAIRNVSYPCDQERVSRSISSASRQRETDGRDRRKRNYHDDDDRERGGDLGYRGRDLIHRDSSHSRSSRKLQGDYHEGQRRYYRDRDREHKSRRRKTDEGFQTRDRTRGRAEEDRGSGRL